MSNHPPQTRGIAAHLGVRGRQMLHLVSKDLRLEWRNRARLIAVVLFGVLVLLLFSLAVGPDSRALVEASGGFLVIALLLSSTLGLQESFRLEHADGGLEGLRLLPASGMALFYAKAISVSLTLLLLGPILAPVAMILYLGEIELAGLAQLVGLWLLAALGLAAPGVLYAGMTSRLRSQDVLLPLLLYPLEVPVLLALVKAFGLILRGDPMQQMNSWVTILLVFIGVYWVLCGILFEYVLEEGS
jgi:heme exporter protein B